MFLVCHLNGPQFLESICNLESVQIESIVSWGFATGQADRNERNAAS